MAVIIDGSGSVSSAEEELEKEFAKSAVASFASRNLFTNGGMASYASFATVASEGGTFGSSAEFDEFVDTAPTASGGTNIEAGLIKGRELLNADSSATASFLIIITDGGWTDGNDPKVRLLQQQYNLSRLLIESVRLNSTQFEWSRALSCLGVGDADADAHETSG